MDHEEPLLLKLFQLRAYSSSQRAAGQLSHQLSLMLRRVVIAAAMKSLKKCPWRPAPVIEGFVEAAAILGRFADHAAHDQRPAVGDLCSRTRSACAKRTPHVSARCRISSSANASRSASQSVADAAHHETTYLEGRARTAGDQQRDFVGNGLDQPQNRG